VPAPAEGRDAPVAGIDKDVARLDSESYAERCDAQVRLEHRGREGLGAVREATRGGRLGVRGRLHAVWVLAHPGGSAAIEELVDLARSDPDPRVQAQAIRAVADLADPILTGHRLASGPGDPDLAARLAALAGGRDPRVVLEVTVAVGRLRWPGAPAWLRRTLGHPDPALAHAAMQAMRRSANWAAVLGLLDGPDAGPMRAVALRALTDRAEPEVVDGLIARLGSEARPEPRRLYADLLARVYKKPGPWTYWGYRPAPRPANTVAWERTEAIAAALDRAMDDPDGAVRVAVLRRMVREKVPTRLATLRRRLEARPAPEAVAAIVEALGEHPADARRGLLATVVADRSQPPATRLAALALWPGDNDATALKELVKLTGVLEDGPVLAAALGRITRRPPPGSARLLIGRLDSPDPDVRAAAVKAAALLDLEGAFAGVQRSLADRDASVRRAAAEAAAVLGLIAPRERLLDLVRDPDPGVRRAGLDALRRLGEPGALPLAVAALADREVQLSALECLAALGGPAQGQAVADLAKRSPTAEVLPLVVRMLTDWGRQPGLSDAERLGLDRAVADVQGTTGMLVRWQVLGPVPPDATATLVARAGWPGQPFEAPPGDVARWKTLFATGTEVRLGLPDDAAAGGPSVCLGAADFTLAEPAAVQLLASSNGTLRIWADDRLVHQRTAARPFQADSDRVQADLGRGPHRVAVEVACASRPPEFHLRFRRRGSSLEQERLIQMALSRPGDPGRGRRVLEDVERSLCLKCHWVGDRGERIGPELTGLGGRFARITIVESILEPSRSIAPGYESVTVALANGRVISGVRAAETERTLTLGDGEGRRHEIPKGDIESRASRPQSTMPEGLEKRLTPEEFVDLVAYLAAQK
jgi:putative heme-binding domain-containing protein